MQYIAKVYYRNWVIRATLCNAEFVDAVFLIHKMFTARFIHVVLFLWKSFSNCIQKCIRDDKYSGLIYMGPMNDCQIVLRKSDSVTTP